VTPHLLTVRFRPGCVPSVRPLFCSLRLIYLVLDPAQKSVQSPACQSPLPPPLFFVFQTCKVNLVLPPTNEMALRTVFFERFPLLSGFPVSTSNPPHVCRFLAFSPFSLNIDFPFPERRLSSHIFSNDSSAPNPLFSSELHALFSRSYCGRARWFRSGLRYPFAPVPTKRGSIFFSYVTSFFG